MRWRAPSGSCCANPALRTRMGESGKVRAVQFSWPSVTAKVDDYYGFVIRRLAAQGQLPPGFSAPVPPAPVRPAGLWTGKPGE